MAVIRQRETRQLKNRTSNTHGTKEALVWPSGLSQFTRHKLYRQGKRDARKGLVYINKYGEITSPYCEALIQSANRRIEMVWAQCNDESFEADVNLKKINIKIKTIDKQLADATIRRDEDLEVVRNRHYDGDDQVSEHLAQRRQANREKPVQDRFARETNALNSEMDAIQGRAIPYRYATTRAKEHARSNEQLVRIDYLWRLSEYAYGASNYIKVTPEMINDTALTNTPRENYEKVFNKKIAEEENVTTSCNISETQNNNLVVRTNG